MSHSMLASTSDWVQIAILTIGLAAAYEVCYRIGRFRPEEVRAAKKSQADVAVGALLAMLGLLLAFSFGIGEARFEKRKELVLAEANTITTTYLRADMLPAPQNERIHELLAQYVEHRTGITAPAEVERAIRDSAQLHAEMWSSAMVVARANPTSPTIALFVDSLNKLIELREARVTVALFQRIPPAILVILYIASFLSIGMVGLRAGLDRSRGVLPAAVLIIVIMSVMTLIRSLDEPVSQLFHISQHALQDTQNLIRNSQTLSSAP